MVADGVQKGDTTPPLLHPVHPVILAILILTRGSSDPGRRIENREVRSENGRGEEGKPQNIEQMNFECRR
jgi:hypothetical protein